MNEVRHSSIGALLKYRDSQAVVLTLENAANHLYRMGATDSELEAMRKIDTIKNILVLVHRVHDSFTCTTKNCPACEQESAIEGIRQ